MNKKCDIDKISQVSAALVPELLSFTVSLLLDSKQWKLNILLQSTQHKVLSEGGGCCRHCQTNFLGSSSTSAKNRVGPLLTPKPERWPFFVLLEHFVAEVCSSAALPTLAGGCHCQLLQRFQSSGLQVALLGSACLHRMWRYVFRCSHT